MDRQVARINKSDGRKVFNACYSLGRCAFKIGFVGPVKLTGHALREFIFGYMEAKQEREDEKAYRKNLKDTLTSDY